LRAGWVRAPEADHRGGWRDSERELSWFASFDPAIAVRLLAAIDSIRRPAPHDLKSRRDLMAALLRIPSDLAFACGAVYFYW